MSREKSSIVADAPMVASAGGPSRTVGHALADWVQIFRPKQWIKNGFVVTPLLFSGRASEPNAIVQSLAAFGVFTLAAAGVYCWNDVYDRAADQAHPAKRFRPVANGRISPIAASVAGLIAVALSVTLGWMVAPRLAAANVVYIALNIAYTLYVKHIVLVDVFAHASFFILRLLAGVAAIDVRPSVWLLLCGGLLSLYLGFAKRRHELTLLGEASADHRVVLRHYDEATLDQISGILLAVTIVSYLMYTLSSATAVAVGSEALSYSTAFVLFGVFRYVYLVRRTDTGDPTNVLLTDRTLLIDIALWAAYCGWVIYRPV